MVQGFGPRLTDVFPRCACPDRGYGGKSGPSASRPSLMQLTVRCHGIPLVFEGAMPRWLNLSRFWMRLRFALVHHGAVGGTSRAQ